MSAPRVEELGDLILVIRLPWVWHLLYGATGHMGHMGHDGELGRLLFGRSVDLGIYLEAASHIPSLCQSYPAN